MQQRRVREGEKRVSQNKRTPAPPATCIGTQTWTRRGESKAGRTDRPRGQAGPDQTKAGRRRQDGRKTTDPPSKAPLTAGREGGGAEEGRDRRPQGRRSVGGGEKEGEKGRGTEKRGDPGSQGDAAVRGHDPETGAPQEEGRNNTQPHQRRPSFLSTP